MKKMSEFKSDIDYLVKLKRDFSTKEGRYSAQIILPEDKVFYSDSKRSFKVFHAAKKLKSILNPDEFNSQKPTGYFINNSSTWNNDKVFNVDISSAYLTALFNTGKIPQEIFDYIHTMEKPDRLVTLGLLAYEPFLFTFLKGEIIDGKKIKNEFRPIFFYCVKEIYAVSQVISKKLGSDFIFSWVDGFYFYGEKNIYLVHDILRSKKYRFKTYRMLKFNAIQKNDFSLFSFRKYDKDELCDTKICVPLHEKQSLHDYFKINSAPKKTFKQLLNEFLISKKDGDFINI